MSSRDPRMPLKLGVAFLSLPAMSIAAVALTDDAPSPPAATVPAEPATAAPTVDAQAAQNASALAAAAAVLNHDGVPGRWLDGPSGFHAAVAEHRAARKPMMIYVYTDWCPYCNRFNKNVLPDERVQRCVDQFTKVKLNPDRGDDEVALARQLRISGYPTLLIRHPDDLMMTPLQAVGSADDFLKRCEAATRG